MMVKINILERIMASKVNELKMTKRQLPLAVLMERIKNRRLYASFKAAISNGSLQLIAEVKKASPSQGILCKEFFPVALAREYAAGGAAAISVLTESNYFGGRVEHLSYIRDELSLPLLRKDFIFDRYQVYESAAYGADAILLIASVLEEGQLAKLICLSGDLGMDCLVETHNENEINKAICSGAQIIGINNRDLRSFTIDVDITMRLKPLIPENRITVSESGIENRAQVLKIKRWGIDAILVGKALAASSDVKSKIKELIG